MSSKSKRESTLSSEVPADGKKNRRAEIVAALRRCILKKGYAETTITDIAKAANMSASHFLYYYLTKEAVLLDLAQQLHEKVLFAVGVDGDEPPEERIHMLVNNLLVAFPREELGLLREIIAASAHSPPIHANLTEFARLVSTYLEDLFGKTPRQPEMSAEDAAKLASATWMGLLINTAFEEELDDRRARRLFRRTLLSLANIGADHTPKVQTRAPRKRLTKERL